MLQDPVKRRPVPPPPPAARQNNPVLEEVIQNAGHSTLFWASLAAGGIFLVVIPTVAYVVLRDDPMTADAGDEEREPRSTRRGSGNRTNAVSRPAGDPIVAVKAYGVKSNTIETPFFEVDEDWSFRYEVDGVMGGLFVIRDDGSEKVYFGGSSSETVRVMPGGRYKIRIGMYGGDARVAVFQKNSIPLKDIPKNVWVDASFPPGPPPPENGVRQLPVAQGENQPTPAEIQQILKLGGIGWSSPDREVILQTPRTGGDEFWIYPVDFENFDQKTTRLTLAWHVRPGINIRTSNDHYYTLNIGDENGHTGLGIGGLNDQRSGKMMINLRDNVPEFPLKDSLVIWITDSKNKTSSNFVRIRTPGKHLPNLGF